MARDEAGFEIPAEGEWLRGDLHVHATGASNDTGGDSYPQDIATRAQAMGLHFVVLTDHSNSAGSDPTTTDEDPALFNQGPEFVYWTEAAALSVPEMFWMVSGNEISPVTTDDKMEDPRGHIGCIPMTLDGFDIQTPFIDRPKGAVTGGEGLQQALDRGCFAILNHPYALTPWVAYDWTHMGYHGMEVWNGSGGGYDKFDQYGYDAWRCDLLAGRSVTPIAASDNHRVHTDPPGEVLHPALGWPTTAVWSTSRSWDGIVDGLKRGHVALFEGDSRLVLDAYDSDKRLTDGATTRLLRIRGTLDPGANGGNVQLLHATACEDPRPAPQKPVSVTQSVVFEAAVEPGEEIDVAVSIEGQSGVYTATLLTNPPTEIQGSRHAELTRAVVIP